VTRTDRFGKSDVIRGTAPIYASPESDVVSGAVVIDYFLPRSLAQRAAGISQTFEDYFQLRTLHQPILRSYFLALMLIGLVVVLLASWFGMYLARSVTVPIKMLAEGTQAIAHGDLEYEIPSVGDDEIGQLVDSFNRPATCALRRPSWSAAALTPKLCCATSAQAWLGSIRMARSSRSIRTPSGCWG
jgi:two-component system nitrogen regulation sensor histidine kinase NtrY